MTELQVLGLVAAAWVFVAVFPLAVVVFAFVTPERES